MKILLYIVLGVAVILVTFFGLGPVFMADGTMNERIVTLAVVILLYMLLWWMFTRIRKK